ncbi:nitric oxide synthase oxygenase [Paenibacillus doosanensis]|uniref:Nitric oxide synthase oxygenase n=1 Tax=Paenibacillus konkukensis TaxID=2020716 RepID=A0ABY4RJA8_9BACL|nr:MULTISPECIES: nitric oxide synthase oxygenase [Paenibacillus]MCS7464581.1 nitric oxide synthase oxygenase [Paenibacillus doosanensis]UQZ82233.1 Nitric oxide synthase oxygenase [Paenibacillus konkukensis]
MTDNHRKRLAEAAGFIQQYSSETGLSQETAERRIAEIADSLERTGTYRQTAEELKYGARLAWRNNSRCIGRLFWPSLELFDARHLETEDAIAEALFRHIEYATNKGRIRPAITVFAPESEERRIRIWNHQLIRYAGYETGQGIVGDPSSVAFTKQCMRLGWRGRGTPFDVLPLIIAIGDREPKWYPVPPELVLEVPLVHPELERFSELGLKWYALPCISDMLLEVGGVKYTAAPFNGWYMGTEIGARNLSDASRYNQLPRIAELMGLDRSNPAGLWKDRALVELNTAVLYSFKLKGVSIVDHHTASEQFMRFERQEADAGRAVNGKWSWLIPPMSPAATPIWDRYFHENKELRPAFSYQPVPYGNESAAEVGASAEADAPAGSLRRCPFH